MASVKAKLRYHNRPVTFNRKKNDPLKYGGKSLKSTVKSMFKVRLRLPEVVTASVFSFSQFLRILHDRLNPFKIFRGTKCQNPQKSATSTISLKANKI